MMAVTGSAKRIILGRVAAGRCAVVVATRWRQYRCDIAVTASTTGAATSNAARARSASTSIAADETVAPHSDCHIGTTRVALEDFDELVFF